jgi:hypothetical protein
MHTTRRNSRCEMSSLELQRRSEAAAWKLRSVAAHLAMGANRSLCKRPQGERARRLWRDAPIFSQSTEDGVLSILFAATSPHLERGGYYGSNGIGELKGPLPDHASGKRSCCRSAALGVGRVVDWRSPRIDFGPRRAPVRISRNASHDAGTGGSSIQLLSGSKIIEMRAASPSVTGAKLWRTPLS